MTFIDRCTLGSLTRWWLCPLVVVFSLIADGRAVAQQDASIFGQVADESGAVLPGVTVTVTSPALQAREMVAVTNEHGEYRLTPLPIGIYEVSYALAGFQSLKHDGLRLTVGFSAKVDVTLKLGSLAETLTVSGSAPVVDVKSTTSSTQLTRETLELVPTSRNGLVGLMQQAAGVRTNVDVGGSSTTAVPSFRAFGQSNESWQTLEGVVTTSPKANLQSGNYWDYSTLEEAKVQTIGAEADMPTRGVQVIALLKSGSNDIHGTGFWAETNHNFQGSNITPELEAQGITSGDTLLTRRDLSGDVGGRLVRDRLWFYGAMRYRRDNAEVLDTFKPDGSPATSGQIQKFATGKVSYQMSSQNKLVGFLQWSRKAADAGVTRLSAYESRTKERFSSPTGKLEWQSILGSSLFASVQYGRWGWTSERDGFSDSPSSRDISTLLVSGRAPTAGELPLEYRHHTLGKLTWYKPDLFLGSHEFKSGIDYMAGRAGRGFDDRGAAGPYQLIFNNGLPFQFVTWNYPVVPVNLVRYTHAYMQDDWSMGRRLNLELGLRFQHDRGFLPPQNYAGNQFYPPASYPDVEYNSWNNLSPRLHASYDVSGDGRTVVKGGWGRYNSMRKADEIGLANNNVQLTTTYRWADRNGNRAYDAGEVDLEPNGPDFVSRTQTSGAISGSIRNPNERNPKADEFYVSAERELIAEFAVRATGVYTRTFDNYRLANTLRPYAVYSIPIVRPDPGADARLGTGDDPGTTVTYWEYPVALRGNAFQVPTLINSPKNDQTFKSFELAATKRMARGWMMLASYSATRRHEPTITNTGGGTVIALVTDDPNAEINATDDNWERTGKLSATYRAPFKIMVSGNYLFQQGNPWGRSVLVTGGVTIPSQVVRVEPIGTRRYPSLHLLDMRVERSITLSARQAVSLRLNIYNLANVSTVTGLTQQSGTSFNKPTAIIPPRLFELSASYTF